MKKVLALLLTLVLAIGLLAGCSKKEETKTDDKKADNTQSEQKEEKKEEAPKETVKLKVWGDQGELDVLEKLCNEFKASRTDKNYEFEFGAVGAADARARYSEDPAAAADVFLFPDDQLIDLVKADALYEVTRNADQIKSANTAGSVNAATFEGTLYGYPMTSDNGYFLYYDKSVLSEEDVKSLDKILEVANAAGKKVHMDISNGWYIASFFMGNGCRLTVEDGVQICEFDNAAGLEAAQAIKDFCNNPAFVTGDDSALTGGAGDTICAGVSGTWIAEAMKEKLGANYACCKLPTFTCGGKQVQMASFLGCKIYGVNSQTKNPVDAMDVAEYLTNEKAQIARFEALSYGPSNINALANPAVAAEEALVALANQSTYAVSQLVLGNYWTPAEAFGAALEAHSEDDLQGMLTELVKQAVAQ